MNNKLNFNFWYNINWLYPRRPVKTFLKILFFTVHSTLINLILTVSLFKPQQALNAIKSAAKATGLSGTALGTAITASQNGTIIFTIISYLSRWLSV